MEDNSNEEKVTLGDDKVEIITYERYKGRAKHTDRVAFLSTTLVRAKTHFYEGEDGKKVSFWCLSTPKKRAICCEHLGDSAQRFGLVLFLYVTDATGELANPAKVQGRLLYWVISDAKYSELSTLHKQFPLLSDSDKQVDLLINCSEEKFQKMSFTPCTNAHWRKTDKTVQLLRQKETAASEKMRSVLGKRLTELELSTMFAIPVAAPTVSPTSAPEDIDLDGVIDDL